MTVRDMCQEENRTDVKRYEEGGRQAQIFQVWLAYRDVRGGNIGPRPEGNEE